jgi:hypothetical protein
MGYFDSETGEYVTGARAVHPTTGVRAGAGPPRSEPIRRKGLRQMAKQLVPAGAPREAKASTFDVGSQKDRRDLGRAATFVASMDGDQAGQLREWLAAEQAELEKNAGPAEDGRHVHDEKVFLVNDLADDVEAKAAEGAEAQLAFYEAAMEAFGGREELFAWVDQQDDPQAAIVELAEEYLLDQRKSGAEEGEDGGHDFESDD